MSDSYVFISYASADRGRVLPIVAALREAGAKCWIDQHGIEGGANWGQRIAEAIQDCTAFILMSSAASLSSRNVRQEIALAWRWNKPYLPLLLDATPAPTELVYWLETAQWIEVLDHPDSVWLPKVEEAMARLSDGSTLAPIMASAPTAARPTRVISLPSPASSFVGRDREVMEVAGLLQSERVVTLTGPGGIGKTRVAIAVAHRMVDAYQDGVVFVDLAPVVDPALVLSTIAARLSVREAAGQSMREQLASALHARHVLLILDNMEQVIDAAADVGWLVTQCPSLAILSTSREPLRISGEVEYGVASLPVPDAARVRQIEALRDQPGVALFVQRARAVKTGFDLTAENAETIVRICQRLDGLPLAIELAAARARALSPQVLLERLGDPLRFLTGGVRDLPQRQRTIRDAIQWSFDLLSPDEQRLLCRLSVFAGGWGLDAAEAVVNIDGALDLDVVDGLVSLADKSLITQRENEDGETRYGMLTTIREFAREQLTVGDRDALQRAHAGHFAQCMDVAVSSGNRELSVLALVDQEYANLRAGMEWLLDHEPDVAARLIVSLRPLWLDRGRLSEGAALASVALQRMQHGTSGQAALLNLASVMTYSAGHFGAAIQLADEGAAIARALGNTKLLAWTLLNSGHANFWSGNVDQARLRYEEALPLARQSGDPALPITAILGMGGVAQWHGDIDQQVACCEEALALARQLPAPVTWSLPLSQLADAYARRGEIERAWALYAETLSQPLHLTDIRYVIESVEGVAETIDQSAPEQAVVLISAARAARNALGYSLSVRELGRTSPIDHLQRALGQQGFAAAWERGQQLSLDETIALALQATSD